MTSTALDAIRTALSYSGLWCGEATLESFGITRRGRQATCWAAVTSTLKASGYTLERVVAPWDASPSLGKFIVGHPEGDYLIGTADHIMSLRDGKLTDTDLERAGKRRVREVYRVTKEG